VPEKTIHILIVEDNKDHASMAEVALKGQFPESKINLCMDDADLAPLLEKNGYDVVVLDYFLDGKENGLEVLSLIKKHDPHSEVIVVTGLGDENIAAESIKMGASDYIVKTTGYLDRLPLAVERSLRHKEDIRKKEEADAKVLKSKAEYEELIENINLGIFRCELAEGLPISHANSALANILGYSSINDVIGKTVYHVLENLFMPSSFPQKQEKSTAK